MNRVETVQLCYFISASAPNQTMDPKTPEVWHEHLAEIPFGVARQAVAEVVRVKPYVALCDILAVVRRMRQVTRRAIKQAARESGALVNIEAEADVAIIQGFARFDGIDLLAKESQDSRFYRPEVAELSGWVPFRPGISA